MKLFVLLSRFPYPLEKGDKLRAYYQLKELSKNNEIHLHCLTTSPVKTEWVKELEPFCAEINIYKLKKPLIWWNTIKQFFSEAPFQVGYFYQKAIQRKINIAIKKVEPEHIYCQLIRTAEYVKNIHNISKTIDYQDALSAGMLRRAAIAKGIKKRLFQTEGARLAAYENRIFDYFNHHTIISEQDKQLINHPQKEAIKVIKNGISEDFLNFKSDQEKQYDLIFTGNMNYPPNIECCEFLVHKIKPLLNSDISIVLSGATPNQRILDLAKVQNVTVTGWVDDIKNAYASASIFVAPLFIGTGLQNKLLEAMAMGLPCITTSLANNALGATVDEEILVANTAEQFANKIKQLMIDESRFEKISASGKSFVRKEFSWNDTVVKLERLFQA